MAHYSYFLARCPHARSALRRRGRSRRVIRVSSGRERRMTALNPRSLRSETAFKSTDHTADKLHAMALSTHSTMIRFMELHMTWHTPACSVGIRAPFAGVPGRIVTDTVAHISLNVGKPDKRGIKDKQRVSRADSFCCSFCCCCCLSMFRGYVRSLCRCPWSHRQRHRPAHPSRCWNVPMLAT